ncbi:MAG TPA: DNA-3-methyladenine glycosylase [Gemmatimonadaceae bacterium]|nr:DNA-3-methyladenine glycosylase [Gemmatimonadaceae bacterium]
MQVGADVTKKARAHLRRVDPVIARVMESVGPYRPADRASGSHFHALIRSIVFQQLSGKAASTIHGRFLDLYPGGSPTPEQVLATPDEQLRAAGLSRQKIGYLRDLAQRVHTGELPLDHVHTLADAELIAHLVQVRGIGRWTAQMFLMFKLGRMDVLPELDLGIQNAIKRAYRKRKVSPKDVLRIGAKWSPFASIACWYLWRSLDNGGGQLGDAKKK